jgi:predicted GIY-YIG superfamily endonuclease
MMRGRKLLSRAQHDLYRVYDADGNLLYVGASVDAFTRLDQHRNEHQPWWPSARTFTVTRYANGWTARYLEAVAIRDEEPIWNVRKEQMAFCYASRAILEPVEPEETFNI